MESVKKGFLIILSSLFLAGAVILTQIPVEVEALSKSKEITSTAVKTRTAIDRRTARKIIVLPVLWTAVAVFNLVRIKRYMSVTDSQEIPVATKISIRARQVKNVIYLLIGVFAAAVFIYFGFIA